MEQNMEATIYNAFATPIYKSSIGRDFTQEEIKFLFEQAHGADRFDGVWVTNDREILENEILSDLKYRIQVNLDNYFKNIYNTSDDVGLALTSSWVTRLDKGDYHTAHAHQNSIVSGVVYVSLQELDGTMFYRPGVKRWSFNSNEENYYNSDTFAMMAKPGDIILFPSELLHFVPTVTEDVTRVAISINSFFKGTMGAPVPYGTLIHVNSNDGCKKGCKNCKCKS
jgi:uncharacterized protein (TIGR02466 family)